MPQIRQKSKRILAVYISSCLALGSLAPAVAGACEGEEKVFGGELVFKKTSPLKVKLAGPAGVIVNVEYKKDRLGPAKSGKLSILYTTGFENNGVSECEGIELENGKECEVKIKCPTLTDGTTGKSTVESSNEKVRSAKSELECLA
jgi:hypothetical protein